MFPIFTPYYVYQRHLSYQSLNNQALHHQSINSLNSHKISKDNKMQIMKKKNKSPNKLHTHQPINQLQENLIFNLNSHRINQRHLHKLNKVEQSRNRKHHNLQQQMRVNIIG